MRASDITVTDQFCGAGGSSIGAERVGVRLRMALNHWELAIETHNTNFPDADHDCTDVSACDPRRYPSTDILITSPECTNHSLAKGQKRKLAQRDMFTPSAADPASERSRATMWDVCRFAEQHRYEIIVVENVIEARHWICWDAWLLAMHRLGYEHRAVFVNSMFCHPTPQSRDRMYVVFWRRGNRPPDLDLRPPAFCLACDLPVEAVQGWKPGRSAGRYRRQYVYCCPTCAGEVEPYYYAALNAIDWSIPAQRIGDRKRPLRPRTLERIRYGLEKYGRHPLQIITNMTTNGGRVRSLAEPGFTQTGSALTALVHPFLINTRNGSRLECRVKSAATAMGTQTADYDFAVAFPPAALINNMEHNRARSLDQPLHTICTGGNLGLAVHGAALMTMRDSKGGYLLRALSDPLPTQVAAASQDCVISRAPFLVSYYGQNQASGPADPMGTLSTRDRHALVEADDTLDVDDCYFRMLQPQEVGAGMAFPSEYKVLGNKRERVKQYGNAVTPPVMEWLVGRAVESLS